MGASQWVRPRLQNPRPQMIFSRALCGATPARATLQHERIGIQPLAMKWQLESVWEYSQRCTQVDWPRARPLLPLTAIGVARVWRSVALCHPSRALAMGLVIASAGSFNCDKTRLERNPEVVGRRNGRTPGSPRVARLSCSVGGTREGAVNLVCLCVCLCVWDETLPNLAFIDAGSV